MRTLTTILSLFIVSSMAIAQSERSLIRDGNGAYKQGKFADAEVNYRKALNKNQEIESGTFNLGDALYKQGRFDEAAEQYRIAATRQHENDAKAQALHNLGNSLVKGNKIPDGIAAYKEALKLNPKDADTKYNLEYAKALLQQQQQKKQDQKKDDKKDQQKQDKSKEDQKKDQQKQNQQKQDQQKQDQQNQDQQQQTQQKEQDKQQGKQAKKMQISKEDAERILQALRNEERDVQKKLKKKAPARVQVEKDW